MRDDAVDLKIAHHRFICGTGVLMTIGGSLP
jgi:hypothetical protein